MKPLRRIARTELQTMFYSPIAWFILIIFSFQVLFTFVGVIDRYVVSQELGRGIGNLTYGLFASTFYKGVYRVVQSCLYLYIPLLTMGVISRELHSGSIKLLYSSPITNTQIILGKYIAVMVYALVMMLVLAIPVLYGGIFIPHFDWGAALIGLLGMYLLIGAYAAIGIFMSSLTAYQVVAAVGSFAIFAVLNYVEKMWQDIALVRDITYWLSIRGRSEKFIEGMLCSEDFLYFLILIAMFLSFSVIRLAVAREKRGKLIGACKYGLVILIAVTLGYLSSRPRFMGYYDATQNKVNTLVPNSQEIMKQMKGKLTITTYANILDEDRYLHYGYPRAELSDIKRFVQYTRFKPDIKMKYVRYYAKGNNEEALDKRYPTLSDRERMVKIAQNNNIDTLLYLDLEQVSKLEDLSGENYRFVRVLEREDGRKTFLRIFDDIYVHPFESEISAAFKRLVMDLPQVGFVVGHGARDCASLGDRYYGRFAQDKVFRYSLLNQGFDAKEVTLDKPIPEDINILVLADLRDPLPEAHQKNFDDYVARGGNLLIAGEPKRQEQMNPLLEPFGVQLMPGRLVTPDENNAYDFIISTPTKEGGELIYHINSMRLRRYVATMPSVAGLDISGAAEKGFSPTVLMTTDTLKTVWNELKTTDFIDEVPELNPEDGEQEQNSVPTVVALSRQIGDKEQKIVVLGDADCLSNGEISISRKGIAAANYSLITSSFYWMSDNEVPIDVRRPSAPDKKINVSPTGLLVTKVMSLGIFPLALLLYAIFLLIRRKGR